MGTKVVYIFGAGASQQAVYDLGAGSTKVLTKDIAEAIHLQIGDDDELREKCPIAITTWGTAESNANDDGEQPYKPLEELIYLLEQSGNRYSIEESQSLRKCFLEVLSKRIESATGYYEDDTDPRPVDFYTALFDWHKNGERFHDEEFAGAISLNYDTLAERAYGEVYDALSKDDVTSWAIIKLHGSYNWKAGTPPTWQDGVVEDPLTTWIAPGASKAFDRYPFNLLMGRSRELLSADVIRVVGCGLNPADRHLSALLFDAVAFENGRKPIVEVISGKERSEEIKKDYPYFDARTLDQNDDFTDFCMEYCGLDNTKAFHAKGWLSYRYWSLRKSSPEQHHIEQVMEKLYAYTSD